MAYFIAAFAARFMSGHESLGGSQPWREAYKGTSMDAAKSTAAFLLPAGIITIAYQSATSADVMPVAPLALGLLAAGARLHQLAYRADDHLHLKTIAVIVCGFVGLSALTLGWQR